MKINRYIHTSLFLISAISFLGCNPNGPGSQLKVLESRYESLISTHTIFDVDTIKNVSSQLAQTYLEKVDNAPDDGRAPEYLFQAASLNEPNYMNPDYAITLYQRLIDNYPKSPYCAEALFRVAYIHHNVLQNLDVAKTYYQRFIENYPEHELVISARSEIDNLGVSPDSLLKKIIPRDRDSI